MQVISKQDHRPDYYEGTFTFDGCTYRFFTGGEDDSSMPWGRYELYIPRHPKLVELRAIQFADTIYDPKYDIIRDGQSYGYGMMGLTFVGQPKTTGGCLNIHRHDWPSLQDKLWTGLQDKRTFYITIDETGGLIREVLDHGVLQNSE